MIKNNQQLRIVVMTSFPELLLAPLLDSPYKVVGLINLQEKKGLLKTILRQLYWILTRFSFAPNNLSICQKNNIAYRNESGKLSDDLSKWLESLSADVMVLYSAPLIPEKIINASKLGCLNIHPSLLPKYRGPRPIIWMAKDYDLNGGSSVFFVDKGSDTGKIVSQKTFTITPGSNHYQTGRDSLLKCGIPALLESLDLISNNKQQPVIQEKESPTQYARHCSNQEYWDFIDWDKWSLEHTWHYMRCLPFWKIQLEDLSGWKKWVDWEIANYQLADPNNYLPGQLINQHKQLFFSHKQGKILLKPVFPINKLKNLLTKKNLTHSQAKIRRPKLSELGKLFFATMKALPTSIDYKLARYLVTAQLHQCFVIAEGNKIAGFCFYGLHKEDKTFWYNYLGSDPDCRSKGYGRLMTQYLEKYAANNGYQKTGIIIHLFKATHVGAEKFFSREAYQKYEIKDNPDSVHYIKELQNFNKEVKIESKAKSFLGKTLLLILLSVEIIALISVK